MNAAFNSAALFLALNLIAGLLNYLYQVLAAQRLDAQAFSELSAWIAHFSLAFILPSTLQHAANFYPLPGRWRKPLMGSFVLGTWALFFLWLAFPADLSLGRSALIILSACAWAWMVGELQVRLMLITLASVNLGGALLKLGWSYGWGVAGEVSPFATALILGYAPMSLAMFVILWREKDEPTVAARAAWRPALLLSAAAVAIPQMDLIVTHATQNADTFAEFARASLFYKGIYFVVSIFAQWLLPQQLKQTVKLPGEAMLVPIFLIFSLLAGVAAWLGPMAAAHWLGWETTPDKNVIFFSCLNMCLLTWLYLNLQAACADGRLKVASLALAGLALEATIQLLGAWSLKGYFLCALASQLILLVYVMRSTRSN